MANLYETIENLCLRKGIRPGRLCQELGISRGLITDLKMGRKKSVSAETAQKIAAFFGVSVGYLLGQEDPISQVDVAFYGEFLELTEEQKATVRDMVHLMRARRSARETE
jgi:transcriptional regulator with XRE-family HTH domain